MKLIKRWRCRFYQRLPQGTTEFYRWVDDIAELTELPNNDKLKAIIAHFITQLDPSLDRISKEIIARQIRKAAANQVAFEVLSVMDEKNNTKKETPVSNC